MHTKETEGLTSGADDNRAATGAPISESPICTRSTAARGCVLPLFCRYFLQQRSLWDAAVTLYPGKRWISGARVEDGLYDKWALRCAGDQDDG